MKNKVPYEISVSRNTTLITSLCNHGTGQKGIMLTIVKTKGEREEQIAHVSLEIPLDKDLPNQPKVSTFFQRHGLFALFEKWKEKYLETLSSLSTSE